MFEIIIGAVIIFFLWSFFSRRKKAISSFDSIDEAESWFNSEGIDFPTLRFNTYNDPQLAKNIGATVIVGFGQKADGKDVGFVIEVVKGSETKAKDSGELYNHIHIMFIVDAGHNVFGTKELGILINKALNRIDGFEKLTFNNDFDIVKASDGYTCGQGFLKFRDEKSTIYADDATFHDIRCHDLKTEFKDAIIRASYLCKSSQKKELPERYKGSNNQTFGGTRKPRAINSEKIA